MRTAIVATLLLAAATGTYAQTQAATAAASGPTFDVVSIKPNTSGAVGSNGSTPARPDGGFTMLNIPVGVLIGRGYEIAPVDMVGLPGWAMSDRYDVIATSSLPAATPAQRTAMLRTMLADRFKLLVHVEPREQSVYELVVARKDGSLGPGITRSETDCDARLAAQRAATEAALAAGTVPPPPPRPDFNDPVSCTIRLNGDRMEAENTIENIARVLRSMAGLVVVDKTGLKGTYRLTMTFDRMASARGPATTASADAAPSIFTALQEQLGLKLEPAKIMRDTLVIDRLERPSEN